MKTRQEQETHANPQSLDTGYAINSIHEIEQVNEP